METNNKLFTAGAGNITQITSEQFISLPIGSVVLVRSRNVPDLGDHYAVISGGLIEKPYGLRPETLVISAPNMSAFLSMYKSINGVKLLLLNEKARECFYNRYYLKIIGGSLVYPKGLIVNEILNIFSEFRLSPTEIDQYNQVGRKVLFEKLLPFVHAGEPVKFSMLGYPFKSINTVDKVLGDMPDLGEQKSIENFQYFADRIRHVYNPGALISIISDGFIFSDIIGVPDETVIKYNEVVRDMARNAPIAYYDARDFYSGASILEVREKTITQFGITSEELERRILFDPNVNDIYRGMIRFREEDMGLLSFESRKQKHKQAKIKAREGMFRNEAYSALIRHNFADHIRLSMHNSTNTGEKYSFQMVQGKYKYSPWHSCLLVKTDGILETIHKSEGIYRGAELVSVNNQPFYFVER